jgi:hypothetical protein
MSSCGVYVVGPKLRSAVGTLLRLDFRRRNFSKLLLVRRDSLRKRAEPPFLRCPFGQCEVNPALKDATRPSVTA